MLCSPWVSGSEVARRPRLEGLDPTVLDDAAVDASELLYALSGRQFPGLCEEVLRPASRPSSRPLGSWQDYLTTLGLYGSWSSSWGLCLSGDHASCQSPMIIDLMLYPVREIDEVKIGGVVVDETHYRLDNYRELVRTDGGSWPTCQSLTLPDTQPGTFSVSVKWGQAPPHSGISAAGTLAAELAKARSDQPNKLPQRIQTVTRQDVSMTVMDPMQFIQEGLTGIWEIDQFIRSYNPGKQIMPPIAWSPDLPSARRVGTTYP